MASSHHDTPPADRLICVGVVTGARGLGGEVRIKSFTADPDDIAAYGPVSTDGGERSFDIRVTAHAKGQIIARLSGIDDRDDAEALKGERLYVPKSALPEAENGAYYHADLIGLGAETAAGEKLGIVKAVHNFGAGDVIEITGAGDKGGLMVPFTADAVPKVDIENGRIVVRPPAVLEAGAGEDENPDEDES